MKNNILWGFFLLIAGGLFILANFGIINISWDNLWPFVVLIIGLFFRVCLDPFKISLTGIGVLIID